MFARQPTFLEESLSDGLSYLTLSQAWVSYNQNVGIPSDRNPVLKKRSVFLLFKFIVLTHTHTPVHQLHKPRPNTHTYTQNHNRNNNTAKTTTTINSKRRFVSFLFSFSYGLTISLNYRNQTNSSNTNTIAKKPNNTQKVILFCTSKWKWKDIKNI